MRNNDQAELGRTTAKRLLILDDDVMIGETICGIGKFAGFDTWHTACPALFFEQVESWQPDIVAIDLLMPTMDGVAVMARLAEMQYRADLIVTSGVDRRVLDAAGRSAAGHGLNVLGVLSKPFSPAALRALFAQSQHGHEAVAADPQAPAAEPTEADLREAIHKRRITTVYQPKIRCRTGTLAGFEVLARWHHNHSAISPEKFVALAEQTGLIDDLTKLVFDQALNWLAELTNDNDSQGMLGFKLSQASLSLNISALTLTNENFFCWVVDRCDQLDIDRGRLIFELTESSAMQDPIKSLDTLTRLRLQGFHLSIDDFGTGYSSMVQLVRLPFSEIKVDKSFVIDAAAPGSAESRAIIRSIVTLGQSLGLKSTAEGVEDAQTLAILQDLGCDYAQGYYISRPLPAAHLLTWFKARESAREAARARAVEESGLYQTASEPRFDRVIQLAKKLFDVPVSLLTLMHTDQAWVKSQIGVSRSEFPRDQTFCNYTIESDQTLVVEDARTDCRFQSYQMVTGDPSIRFYAGHPVCLPNGAKAGALCVLDSKPRSFSQAEKDLLKELASMVERELAIPLKNEKDPLSGLVDKTSLRIQADATFELAQKVQHPVALQFITLDKLDSINRQFGRSTGDQCLNVITSILQTAADEYDLVGRYRGSELVVVKMGASLMEIEETFTRIENRLRNWKSATPATLPSLHLLASSAVLVSGADSPFDAAIEVARSASSKADFHLGQGQGYLGEQPA